MNSRSALFILFILLYQCNFSTGQTLNIANKIFLEKEVVVLKVDSSYHSDDWSPFRDVLVDKRIILLGEANHGSKEVFRGRNSLIKFLHDSLGFNIILFESGLGELALCDLNKSKLSPKEMSYTLIGPWQTQEFFELLGFAKTEQIAIGGFDIQRSGGGQFTYLLEQEASEAKIPTSDFAHLEKQFGITKKQLEKRSIQFDSIEYSTKTLISQYQNVYNILLENKAQKLEQITYLYCLKTLENRIDYLTYMLSFKETTDWNQRFTARDSLMALNAQWLIDHVFPDEKVIILGHNYHIAKSNPDLPVMGAYLKTHFGEEIYSCGFYSGAGLHTGNNGKPTATLAADSSSLDVKHIIEFVASPVAFLNIPKHPKPGAEFLFVPIIINDSFINLSGANSAVLSELFDGLILIDKSSVPEKPR